MASSDKRTPGAPFRPHRAEMHNAIVGAGEEYLASRFNSGAPTKKDPRSLGVIKCKNGSGAARAKGEVLGAFTKSLTNLTAENIWLVGNAPAAGKAFGVYLKAAPDGEYVDMQLSGVCLATVTISDTDHQFADIDPPNFKLVSAESGPVRIVYAPASTGDQECCVNLGGGGGAGVSLFRFTLTSGWTGGVADADIKDIDDGSTVESDSVRDSIGMFSDGSTGSLISGDSGYCEKQNGKYYIYNAPCGSHA